MQTPTLLGYCTDAYLPTRIGMKATSAQQLRLAAVLYDVPLSSLSETALSRVLAEYCQTHSPATTNSKRGSILTLWAAAAIAGLCNAPDRRLVPRAREYKRIPRAWTQIEIERLLAVAGSVRGEIDGIPKRLYWPSLVLAIWNTSERIGSLLSARTDDCNLGERYLILRAETDKSGSDRYHPLLQSTAAAIASHYRPGRQRVWPWPWHRRQIWVQFKRIVLAAGLQPDPSMGLFHKIRRTSISYTAANGGIEMAQAQAGHASATTTRRHYIDPRIAQQRTAIDVLPVLKLPHSDPQMRLF